MIEFFWIPSVRMDVNMGVEFDPFTAQIYK